MPLLQFEYDKDHLLFYLVHLTNVQKLGSLLTITLGELMHNNSTD